MLSRRKGRMLLLLVCVFGLLTAGCAKKEAEPWVPDGTAIQVAADGTVTETIIDRLNQSYYNSQELQQLVYSTVNDYAAAHGNDRLQVEEFLAEGQNIRIVLKYASGADYAAYNNVRFYNGSMLGAQMEGFLFETTFQIVAKDGTVSQQRVTPDGPVSHKEYQVLVTDRSHKVEVPGDIVYVSAPSAVENRRIVTPLSYEENTDGSAVSEEEAGLLYVLYEYGG